jgi:hypothetical protein
MNVSFGLGTHTLGTFGECRGSSIASAKAGILPTNRG